MSGTFRISHLRRVLFSTPNALKAGACSILIELKAKCRGIFWGLELSMSGNYTVEQLRSKREAGSVEMDTPTSFCNRELQDYWSQADAKLCVVLQ